MMGGEIGVESVYGEGSTFFFTARLGIAGEKEKKKRIIPEELNELKVLVVDDSATSREVLQSYLEDFSFEVVCAENGEGAMSEVRRAQEEKKSFDVVLMDYQMPGMNGVKTAERIWDAVPEKRPKIILVTGYGREEVFRRAETAGLDAFLVKPVNQSQLFNTMLEAYGQEAVGGSGSREEQRPEGFENVRGARLLLVEDNEINQQVAAEMLEAEGFVVEIAGDGRQAVDTLSGQPDRYELVLMDLQMPVMNGFEAAREIRAREELKELPIVAMTADAMSGVREQVLEAGMNDYVSKPIEPVQLWQALVQWIPAGERDLPAGFLTQAGDSTAKAEIEILAVEGLDTEDGLRRVGGNRKLYREILVKFIRDFRDSKEEIGKLVAEGDVETAERLAHTVKGVAGSIGAGELQTAATELDDELKAEDTGMAEKLLSPFGEKLDALVSALGEVGIQEVEDEATDSATGVEVIGSERLVSLLEELKPHLEKRQPKRCLPLLEGLGKYALPKTQAAYLKELTSTVRRYRFKEAQAAYDAWVGELG